MALPAVEMGVAYPVDLSALLASAGNQSDAIGYDTYHTITYAPDSHVQKGVPIVPIDPTQSGYLTATPARSGTGNSVELGFSNTSGETQAFSGILLPSRNECVLLFDGSSFVLKQVSSSALSMVEVKKSTDRKRSAEMSDLPEAKKAKLSGAVPSLTPPSPVATGSPGGLPSSPRASTPLVNFSLGGGKPKATSSVSSLAAPVASVSSPEPRVDVVASVPNAKLSQSTELRAKVQAHWDEPDSNSSDDSD